MNPTTSAEEEESELRKMTFCGVTSTALEPQVPDADKCTTWRELLDAVSSSVADPDPVTLSLLLMGWLDGSLPQVVYLNTELLSRCRWRHSQILTDHFWLSFIRNYLPGLQARQKWQAIRDNLTEDRVVMLVDPQLPRAHWPIGRVDKVYSSADGQVRSADVKIKDKIYTRPVAHLVVLPSIPDNEDHPSN